MAVNSNNFASDGKFFHLSSNNQGAYVIRVLDKLAHLLSVLERVCATMNTSVSYACWMIKSWFCRKSESDAALRN